MLSNPLFEEPIDLIDKIREQTRLYKEEYGFKLEIIEMRPETKEIVISQINERYRLFPQDQFVMLQGMQLETDPSLREDVLFQLSKD